MTRQTRLLTLGGLALSAPFISGRVRAHYRRDLDIAEERLDALGSRVIDTSCAPIECVERGEGYPVLVVHGIFGGFDQGLVDAGRTFADGYRLIIPSRFGYLRTPLPPDASPAGQADAYAALLERLGVQRVIVAGYSAGATSAIQFSLRYPERVAALLLVSPNAPGPTSAAPPPPKQIVRLLFKSDFLVWLAVTYAPSALQAAMGVPKSFKLTREDEVQVAEMMRTLLPAKLRGQGVLFDMYISNPGINLGYHFDQISAPTLVVSARDDTLASYDDAKYLSTLIPGSRLLTVASGGHMNLGQHDVVDREIRTFMLEHLQEQVERRLELAGLVS